MASGFLLIDQGNTRLKYRLVHPDGSIIREATLRNDDLKNDDWAAGLDPEMVMMLSSGLFQSRPHQLWPGVAVHRLDASDAAGIQWAYKETSQLGKDRMAAMMGARALFPETSLVIADAGTCLTVDLLRADGCHLGGFISPGLQMRLDAMHRLTSALPRAEPEFRRAVPGSDTISCLQAGALYGLLAELDGHFREAFADGRGGHKCILTGGNAKDLSHLLKESTFVAEDLVFRGLYLACLSRI